MPLVRTYKKKQHGPGMEHGCRICTEPPHWEQRQCTFRACVSYASRTTGMDETGASRTCSLSFLPSAGACNVSLSYLSCRIAPRLVPFIPPWLKYVPGSKTSCSFSFLRSAAQYQNRTCSLQACVWHHNIQHTLWCCFVQYQGGRVGAGRSLTRAPPTPTDPDGTLYPELPGNLE
eukprot:gene15460-biopygen14260